MNYMDIKRCDIANGTGVRTSLFVSGCTHHCKGCFNQDTWDFNAGKPFTQKEIDTIIELCKPDHIVGLTLLGGEPLEFVNQQGLLPLLEQFKSTYPDKTIWCYTGYDFEKDVLDKMYYQWDFTHKFLSYLDVLVDGEFVEEKKVLDLRFRGSTNQRILDVPKSLTAKTTFMKDIKKRWGTTKLKNMFQLQFHFGRGQLMSFHKFFLPDFLYIINQLPNRKVYRLITELIYENTYLKKLNEPVQENVNLNVMKNELQFELKDYQLTFIENYDKIKQKYSLKGYLLAFDTGLGKDQWVGCKIKVPNGWKRMGDIKVGDTVIAKDGTPSNVLGVYPQGKKDMYQITFADGRSTLCSLTHLWKVYHKNINRSYPDKPHWKICETKEIIRLLSIKNTFTYVDLIEPEITKDIDLPIDPYVLGVLLGDGSISSGSITLTTDEEILLRVKEKLPSSMILNIRGYKLNNCSYCKDARIITNKNSKSELSLIDILKNLNLYGCRSWEKYIPEEYLEDASFNQKLELLRGLLDTDGYVDGVKDTNCGSI
mgnify:CR=1 FL=1